MRLMDEEKKRCFKASVNYQDKVNVVMEIRSLSNKGVHT